MKTLFRTAMLVAAVALLPACATSYVATWKNPEAEPVQFRGAKVAAVVMMKDQASRRTAEDVLAREITAHGADGVPMYVLLPDVEPSNEPETRAALERAGVQGVVVMRPVKTEQSLRVVPGSPLGPPYRSYWGGYFGYGWGAPWPWAFGVRSQDVEVDTVVSVETLVYSLKQNRLIWSGTSKTTNPPKVEAFIHQLAQQAAQQLQKEALLAP
ncbi:MAG: hypothetical protein QM696_00610 [Steroidobacteraceae bacterium]